MREIHRGLPAKDFNKPVDGVIQATVCSVSGKIPTPECGSHITTQWLLAGTQPTDVCPVHGGKASGQSSIGITRLKNEMYQSGQRSTTKFEQSPLKLNLDFLNGGAINSNQGSAGKTDTKAEKAPEVLPDYNYLMD